MTELVQSLSKEIAEYADCVEASETGSYPLHGWDLSSLDKFLLVIGENVPNLAGAALDASSLNGEAYHLCRWQWEKVQNPNFDVEEIQQMGEEIDKIKSQLVQTLRNIVNH